MSKPSTKPNCPNFSSGPCAKRPGWSLAGLDASMLGRSHRAAKPKAQLQKVIEDHRTLLGIPAGYKIGIMAGSDTGAFEQAMWCMLGARGVDALAWEAFGTDWLKDITTELKLTDVREFSAAYGSLPDLSQVSGDRDIVFTWNGTTSGVRVPNGDWIPTDRAGLTFCDATSAVFAYDLPWEKLDVTTWSWQKVLGGEAAHGMLVLSPRAVERLESFKPNRPLPKLFRLTAKAKLAEAVFEGATINTPSMLCVADCLDALKWVENLGGFKATMARTQANFKAIETWVNQSTWCDFLAGNAASRSHTSVCLKVKDAAFLALSDEAQQAALKGLVKALESEGVAYDIASYRDAPSGLRIWCGATVEAADVQALLPWLDWAYEAEMAKVKQAAA